MVKSREISLIKSKLTAYKMGLDRALSKGNSSEVKKWQDGIASLEKRLEATDCK